MNAIFKQNDRMGSLSTILGQDVLNLLRFDGEEHLNELFTSRIEALAKTDHLAQGPGKDVARLCVNQDRGQNPRHRARPANGGHGWRRRNRLRRIRRDRGALPLGPRANQIGRPGEGPRGQGNLTVSVERSKVQTVGESHFEQIGERKSTNVGTSYDLFAKKNIHIEADQEIRLTCGPTQLTMTSDGNIRVNGKKIFNVASDLVELLADKVKIN